MLKNNISKQGTFLKNNMLLNGKICTSGIT